MVCYLDFRELRKWVSKKKQKIEQILLQSNPLDSITNEVYTSSHKYPEKKTVLSKEQEEHLRKRKDEEQLRFQEIHTLTHPLREGHSDNQQRLKDLLKLNEQSCKCCFLGTIHYL